MTAFFRVFLGRPQKVSLDLFRVKRCFELGNSRMSSIVSKNYKTVTKM